MTAPEEHPDYCGRVFDREGEPFILVCPEHIDEYVVNPIPYTETGGKVLAQEDRDRIREKLRERRATDEDPRRNIREHYENEED